MFVETSQETWCFRWKSNIVTIYTRVLETAFKFPNKKYIRGSRNIKLEISIRSERVIAKPQMYGWKIAHRHEKHLKGKEIFEKLLRIICVHRKIPERMEVLDMKFLRPKLDTVRRILNNILNIFKYHFVSS